MKSWKKKKKKTFSKTEAKQNDNYGSREIMQNVTETA